MASAVESSFGCKLPKSGQVHLFFINYNFAAEIVRNYEQNGHSVSDGFSKLSENNSPHLCCSHQRSNEHRKRKIRCIQRSFHGAGPTHSAVCFSPICVKVAFVPRIKSNILVSYIVEVISKHHFVRLVAIVARCRDLVPGHSSENISDLSRVIITCHQVECSCLDISKCCGCLCCVKPIGSNRIDLV